MNRLPLSRSSDEGVNAAADRIRTLDPLPSSGRLCLLKCESVSLH